MPGGGLVQRVLSLGRRLEGVGVALKEGRRFVQSSVCRLLRR